MALFQMRLARARDLLIAGLLLVITAHFLPIEQAWIHPSVTTPDPNYNFVAAAWTEVGKIAQRPSSYTPAHWRGCLIFIGTALLLLALPFLTGILSRARTLRWLAIVMLAAATGSALYYITLWWGNLAASGCHVTLTGLWFVLLGLLLIPDACAGEAAAKRWKLPLTLAILFTVLIASPRIFRRQVDRWLDNERQSQNHAVLYRMSWVLEEFGTEAGRFPMNQEGWEPLLLKPAVWPLAHGDPSAPTKPWHPFLTDIPRDPWGGEYRYDLKNDEPPSVISKGPDGLPGTADDIVGP